MSYRPVLDLLVYLRANGFIVFGGIEFMRRRYMTPHRNRSSAAAARLSLKCVTASPFFCVYKS
jgi:hypothetical protein